MAEAEVFNSLKESDSFKRWIWPSENGNDLTNLDEKCFHHLFMGPFVYTIYDDADLDFERKFIIMTIGFTQFTLKEIKKRFKTDHDENFSLIFL